MPIVCISVARVRPRTSKGITDLLLPSTSTPLTGCRSPRRKKSAALEAPKNMRETAPTLGLGLARYRNQPDKSPHELRTAMHHHP
ncbi:hypothetical protein M407DRAFT_193239 [Tulasnella calospora MUT 4182]|uniref:Uncharacterized protein n=1 Tax=Tulasnella calospora MUT 4182 TaxID=1051891 RepID=A0A0C3Q120_9AGAM|nr:hypothetical protein M407DRAFT_193239 [Tulasnella calospora MUT 4182]